MGSGLVRETGEGCPGNRTAVQCADYDGQHKKENILQNSQYSRQCVHPKLGPRTVGCTVVMLQGTDSRCCPLEQLGHGTLKPSLFTSYTGISLQSAQTPERPKIRFLCVRPSVNLLSPSVDNHRSSSEASL